MPLYLLSFFLIFDCYVIVHSLNPQRLLFLAVQELVITLDVGMLIDAQPFGDIVRKQCPVLCMWLLIPIMEVTEMVLVLILYLFTVHLDEQTDQLGTNRIVIQISSLKKARIP